jgi:DNA-binding response OmpR family regulator
MTKQIIVAEDDKAILEVVKIILENDGYKVLPTDKEQEIYEHIQKHTPDMILLDIWLAGEDGGKIARKIKNNKETKQIPIVMISANNETEKISKEVGADDFLLKPFDIDDLLKMVKKYTASKE